MRSPLVRCPAVVGAMALASIVAGCRGSGAVPPDPAALATKVKVVVAQPRTVEDASEYVATIKSRSSATLQPQVEGQITRIFVKSGDRVEAGAPILQIDPLKQSATVSSQDATRKAKLATLDWTRAQLERAKGLFAQGITSKADLDQAQTAYDAALADLSSLEAQVKEQEVQLKYYGVSAPTAGIVGDVPVHVGDRVMTSTLLTTIDQGRASRPTSTCRVERAAQVRLGTPVEIVDAEGKVLAQSRVSFVSPQVDNVTQSVLVKAALGRAEGGARSSQFVRARVIWKAEPGLVDPGDRRVPGERTVLRLRGRAEGQGPRGAPAAGAPRRDPRQRLRGARRDQARRPRDRLGRAEPRRRHARGRELDRSRPWRRLAPRASSTSSSAGRSSRRSARCSSCSRARSASPRCPSRSIPQLAPPQVTVSSFYTGANAQAVETAVTTPLEQAINGVEGMRYMTSSSGNDGSSQITRHLRPHPQPRPRRGRRAEPGLHRAGRLPNEVKTTGVVISKNSGPFVLAAGFYAEDDQYDTRSSATTSTSTCKDALKRVPGVGDVMIFGERKYSMRLWLDPVRLAAPQARPPPTWWRRSASRTCRSRRARWASRRRPPDRRTRSACARWAGCASRRSSTASSSSAPARRDARPR